MHSLLNLFVLLSLPLLASCGNVDDSSTELSQEWQPISAPNNINATLEFSLSALPLSGETATTPWADTYWPSNRGGIAQRWQTQTPGFTYTSPTKAALQSMSQADIAKLSPAEKFDILRRQYTYPTVAFERSRTSPNNESWEGICHGWAPASLSFTEPKPVDVTNADGIVIPFGSSDTKALLSHYTALFSPTGPRSLGVRCFSDVSGAAHGEPCADVNAGAFHIVIANELGLQNKGIVIDVTASSQVWNQPVYKYTSQIQSYNAPSANAAPGTVKEAVVSTTIWYAKEVNPRWDVVGSAATPVAGIVYNYRLELDANDKIIGGEWIASQGPDVLWIQPHQMFLNSYAKLKSLYEASIQ